MGQFKRNRHVVCRFVAGITEHHALVACALIVLIGTVYATVNIGTLFVNGRKNTAAIAVELVFSPCVTNLIDGFACDGRNIDIFFRAYFAHNNYLSGSVESFNCATRSIVVGKELVEKGIANLVGNLVWVPF